MMALPPPTAAVRPGITWVLLAALAAGCGGLDTPDLSQGVVAGRIVGAVPGRAYVYPLGNPAAKVQVAADGSFQLALPAATAELVLWDGSGDPQAAVAGGAGRAERIAVTVRGADVVRLADRYGEAAALPPGRSKMPFAGGVLAGARAETGALCKNPTFEVKGTDLRRMATSAVPAEYLAPLPAGTYDLQVTMNGFVTRSETVTVAEGTPAAEEVELAVDDDDEHRGCLATGGCEHEDDGVVCNVATGRCEAPVVPACGGACDGEGGAICPAGLSCQSGQCSPRVSCQRWLEVIGTSCVWEENCEGALHGGLCLQREDHEPGYCTAPCETQEQCAPLPGGPWTCSDGRCRR